MPKSRRRRTSKQNLQSGPITILLLIIVAAIYLFQLWQEENGEIDLLATPRVEVTSQLPQLATAEPGAASSGGSISVFFTDPYAPNAGDRTGGPEEELIASINAAENSIDMAIYNFSLVNVADALLDANERGVLVRVVMESEAMENQQPLRLQEAGIPMVGDQREGLMHNKFIIIDNQEVWTGSLNLTGTGTYNDHNNLVRIRSQRMAQNYAVEFNEFFVEGLFGPAGRDNTPYPEITIDGIPVEVYFSPDDGVSEEVVAEIMAAETSVDFLAYSFTSDPIVGAMLEKAAAGVQLRGVFDESQVASNRGGEFDPLKDAGFSVKIDGNRGLLHHKVIIIDGETVITGSYNFSASAEDRNDENLIIIHDSGLAGQYLREFETIYSRGH